MTTEIWTALQYDIIIILNRSEISTCKWNRNLKKNFVPTFVTLVSVVLLFSLLIVKHSLVGTIKKLNLANEWDFLYRPSYLSLRIRHDVETKVDVIHFYL